MHTPDNDYRYYRGLDYSPASLTEIFLKNYPLYIARILFEHFPKDQCPVSQPLNALGKVVREIRGKLSMAQSFICNFVLRKDLTGECVSFPINCSAPEFTDERVCGEHYHVSGDSHLLHGEMQIKVSGEDCSRIRWKEMPDTITSPLEPTQPPTPTEGLTPTEDPTQTHFLDETPSSTLDMTTSLSDSPWEGSLTLTGSDSLSKKLVPTPSIPMSRTPTGLFSKRSPSLPETETFSGSKTSSGAGSNTFPRSGTNSRFFSSSNTFPRTETPSISTEVSDTLSLIAWLANQPSDQMLDFYSWSQIIANGAAGSPARRWGHVSGEVDGKFFAAFGQQAYITNLMYDGYTFDPVTSTWQAFSGSPSASESCASFINGSSTLVYGGYNADSNLEEFSSNGYQAFSTTDPLSALLGAAMGTIGGNILRFGGQVGVGTQILNSLWTLPLLPQSPWTWRDITPLSSPSTRAHAQMEVVGENAYLFGGYTSGGAVVPNDLWSYSPISNWTLRIPSTSASTSPVARAGHAMSIFGNNNIIMFGGIDGSSNPMNDLWKLNTEKMTWTELMANGQAGSPNPRGYYGSLVPINSDLYLFGGTDYSNTGSALDCYNDLWKLHLETVALFDIRVSPNPIQSGQPFNLSWQTNITGGSANHVASVLFDGQNYTSTYANPYGSVVLQALESLMNFSVQLFVKDAANYNAQVNQTINFTRQS